MEQKLIYIAGIGHNGSTFLDLALGKNEEFFSTGQLNDLLIPYNPYLGSGAKEIFWRKVLAQSKVDQNLLRELNGKVLKERNLARFISSGKLRRSFSDLNWRIIEEIQNEAGARIVIDSSKNISRGIGLLEKNKNQIFIIHLVRSCRGFVHSVNKRRKNSCSPPATASAVARWLLKNTAASLFVRGKAKNYLLVRWKNLIAFPNECVKNISHFLGESLPCTYRVFLGQDQLFPANSYCCGGNRILGESVITLRR